MNESRSARHRPVSVGDVVAVIQKTCGNKFYAELATVTAIHDDALWVNFEDEDEETDYLIPRERIVTR